MAAQLELKRKFISINPLLFINTIRYLRPIQVTDRIRRLVVKPRIVFARSGEWRLRAPGVCAELAAPSADSRDGDRFSLINETRQLYGENRWRPAGATRLWIYHLHYFDYLDRNGGADDLELMRNWITKNPALSSPGWEPYPLSIRIRAWLEWLARRYSSLPADDRDLMLRSIADQTSVLSQSLEYHLQGNHLLENAITLTWAGLRLEGPLSARWLTDGLVLLEREIGKQILDDGMHEERSPAYQAVLCHALIRLATVGRLVGDNTGHRVADLCELTATRMLRALGYLTHPDGRIALFNDAGLDWAPIASELASAVDWRSDLVPEGAWALPTAGYFGWSRADCYFVFDAGPIGPEHQPGHGHADALSFELSVGGERLVADTGVGTYEQGVERLWDRGTAAHNTVQVNNGDQCELWKSFRCGRRPSVYAEKSREPKGMAQAAFSGVANVKTKATGAYRHERNVKFVPGKIEFKDHVVAKHRIDIVMRIHLAPGVTVQLTETGRRADLWRGGQRIAIVHNSVRDWTVSESPYRPSFNVESTRECLMLDIGRQLSAEWTWTISWDMHNYENSGY